MDYFELLDKNATYVAGVSGGCDSMMLLSSCAERGIKVIVAFINYKLRKSSQLEEELVDRFCQERNIPVHKLYPKQKKKGNFQQWARKVRYEFYEQLYREYGCSGLLLGHQQDDSVENYLMSKARGSQGWYAGIPFHHIVGSMEIYRPLINKRKKETREYCLVNNVPFHDDESNFTNKYFRNRIRHSKVEKATEQQYDQWLKEIEEHDSRQKELLDYINDRYPHDEDINRDGFLKEEDRMQESIIRWHLCSLDGLRSYSGSFISDICQKIRTTDKGHVAIADSELVWEYGRIYIWTKEKRHEYILNEVEYFDAGHFAIRDQGRTIEGVTLTEDDFPITIRAWKSSDEIELRYGHKKVSRFLIDRKIPRRERYYWPVIVNSQGRVIFVSGVGCDVQHYSIKPTMFMIK